MKSLWNKLKVKWNIESDKRMAWIFLVFALTGSSIGFVRKPVVHFLFNKETYSQLNWYELIITIVIIYFVYQINLLIVGTLMGEHKFVKWFVLKMNKRLFPFIKNI